MAKVIWIKKKIIKKLARYTKNFGGFSVLDEFETQLQLKLASGAGLCLSVKQSATISSWNK